LLQVGFIPIILGTFCCLVLFIDDKAGEFMIEIVGKSTLLNAIEIPVSKIKAEQGTRCSFTISLDILNQPLTRAIAYAIEKSLSFGAFITEQKLKDQITRRQRELDNLFKQGITSTAFFIDNSAPQFFEVSKDFVLKKALKGQPSPNAISVTFTPPKPGDYPSKLILI
jgi:hypothetical protein